MDCREMQLTNAEIDNTEAIKKSMKNGVGYGRWLGRKKSTFQSKPFNNATTLGVDRL